MIKDKDQVPVAAGKASEPFQPLLTTVMDDEEILNTAAPTAYVELSEIARTAPILPPNDLRSVCSVCDTDLRRLFKLHAMGIGDSLLGNVDLVLSDPLYNVRSNTGKANSEIDLFTLDDIRDSFERCTAFRALTAYGNRFCAWVQFGRWYQTLLRQKGKRPSDSLVDHGESVVQKPVIDVKAKPPHNMRNLHIISVMLDLSRLVPPQ